MPKIFLSICFIFALALPQSLAAETIELNNEQELRAREAQPHPSEVVDERIPDGSDIGEVEDFIRDRFDKYNIIIEKLPEDSTQSGNAVDIQHSSEYIEKVQQDSQSTFEKIYNSALDRISAQQSAEYQDVLSDRQALERENLRQKQQWQEERPDFPVVNVYLPPYGRKILAPAREHIPFFFSNIDILPTGQISIEETVVVIANGRKLRHGLTRALPRYSVSRTGQRHNIDINLNEVTINDTLIPYKLQTNTTHNLLLPQIPYVLEPGVYTYKFRYIVNRNIWEYDNFNEFYWNITGSSWNLVIARAGAIVTMPGASKPLGYTALSGYPGRLRSDVSIFTAGNYALGFAANNPLYTAEGMHLIVSLDKNEFIAPDFNQRFTWFLSDYGDIIISGIALAAIIIAYFISWKTLHRDEKKRRQKIRRTASLLRYMVKGVFDGRSFSAFLLELFRKNIIDIQKNDGHVVLIKKTDNLRSLSRAAKKAMTALFGKETSFVFSDSTVLKAGRAFSLVRRDTLRHYRLSTIRLNLGYILFSTAMLLLAEFSIAWMGNNTVQDFSVMLSCSLAFACYVWVIRHRFRSRLINWGAKILSLLIIVFNLVLLSFFIHILASLFILGAICAIFAYTGIFSRRNGLIGSSIKEAAAYRDYLKQHAGDISLGRDFLTRQAEIHAVEADEFFPCAAAIKDYYRLDLAQEIDKLLPGGK